MINYDPRRRVLVPKRNWFQRNPRVWSSALTVSALLIFFSKPLYDAFIAEENPNKRELRSFRIGPK